MTLIQDVMTLQQQLAEAQHQLEEQSRTLGAHEEQINGRRGMQQAINDLAVEVRSLRKAAYWVGGIIVASSIGFAFGVLTLVPG